MRPLCFVHFTCKFACLLSFVFTRRRYSRMRLAAPPSDRAEPDPSPFLLEGGSTGVLLIHGFTGSPAELRLLGAYVHERGVTVSAPLLPGHGTTPADLDRCTHLDWLRHARRALEELRDRSETVFLGGISFGAAIALELASSEPDIAGVLAYSPAVLVPDWQRLLLPIAGIILGRLPKPGKDVRDVEAKKHLWSYPSYPVSATREVCRLARTVRPLIPNIAQPLLVVRSMDDRTIPPEAGRLLYERVASTDKKLVTLHDSGHVVTVDREWRRVAEESWEFIRHRSVWHNDPRETNGTGD
jgi:carboxylesterase